MPIPTRSGSLREPRKPASSIARPPNTTNAKPPARSTTASSSSTPPLEVPAKDSSIPRGRTLLPQPSHSTRDDVQALGPARLPAPESRLPQRGSPSPKRQPQINAEPARRGTLSTTPSGVAGPGPASTRRQSLMRPPSTSKPLSVKSNVSASKPVAPLSAPPTQKQIPSRPAAPVSAQRPSSPKKNDMPPPPRPARSVSLRQPAGVTAGPATAARGHIRHRSQLTPTTTKPAADATPVVSKSRPGFSTFQQHYSPRKATKPPTPTPGEAPGQDTLLIPCSWPDIAALQTELLQLSLFHSSQLQRQTEWKSESEKCLQKLYDTVAAQYKTVLQDEKMRQRQLNTQALDCWAQNCQDHNGAHGFPEQIQVLSQVLQEVSDLVVNDTGGRYAWLIDTFEDWIEVVGQIRQDREASGILADLVFIDPLDGRWKEELQGLQAKLELGARQLQSLDILGFGEIERLEQSALTRISVGLGESLRLMLQEIRAMQLLEAEVVRSERETVRNLATQLSTGPPPGPSQMHEAVWRTGRV